MARDGSRPPGPCLLYTSDAADDEATHPDPLDGDLRPAARRTTEIDDTLAKPQQPKALVELDQLEGGARAVAEPARLDNVGIVKLARQPSRRGRFAPTRAADCDHRKAGAG